MDNQYHKAYKPSGGGTTGENEKWRERISKGKENLDLTFILFVKE